MVAGHVQRFQHCKLHRATSKPDRAGHEEDWMSDTRWMAKGQMMDNKSRERLKTCWWDNIRKETESLFRIRNWQAAARNRVAGGKGWGGWKINLDCTTTGRSPIRFKMTEEIRENSHFLKKHSTFKSWSDQGGVASLIYALF